MVHRRQQWRWFNLWRQRGGNKPFSRSTSAANSDLEEAVVTVIAPRTYNAEGPREACHNPEQELNNAVLENGEPTEGRNGETQASSSITRSIQQRLSCFQWAVIFLFVFSVIVVAVVVPVVKNQNDSPSPQTQLPPLDTAYLQEIRALLVPPELWSVSNAPQLRATELMAIQQPPISVNSSRLYQRYAILTMYFTNGGERWHDVDPMMHECDWFLVECTSQKVVELNMGNRLDMTGSLVSELGLLSLLRIADFGRNRLEGTIPGTLYELTNLVTLRLSSNRLTSTISSSIGNLTKLRSLHLNDNFFNGTLPSSLGLLTGLTRIAVEGNFFTGNTLLEYMPIWTNLEYFDVSDTDISGTIPTEVGLLTSLIEIEAFGSRITGTLPSELGLLDKLHSFATYDSGLSGTLPSTLGNLKSAEYLLLSQLFLTGTIPTEIGKMEMLVSLSLSLNTLNGTIPTELGRLTNVQELYFIYNHLTGTVPSQLGNLSKLERLSLFRMQLSGSMPSEICALFDNGALMQLENSCEMVACDCCTRCINPTTVGTGGNN